MARSDPLHPTTTTDGDRDVVLVVTARSDETGDAVEAELGRHDCTVVRLDIGDFPARMSVSLTSAGAPIAAALAELLAVGTGSVALPSPSGRRR